MKKLQTLTVLLAASHTLAASSTQLTQARADLLAGSFDSADQTLQTVISSEPQNTEARLLKCLSEGGRFIEETLVEFLTNSVGTDSTRTAEALDASLLISGTGNSGAAAYAIYDPNPDNGGAFLYDWTPPAHGLGNLAESGAGGNWLDRLFNYETQSETTVGMTRQSGVFSTPEGVRRCGLTFQFTGTTAEQVDFQLTWDSSSDRAPLKIYFNGIAIGKIHSTWGYLDVGDSDIYLNSADYLSVRMQNGDRISFEVEQSDRSDPMYAPSATNLSIEALDPWVLDFENGVVYSSYFPILKAGANLNDLSDFFLSASGSFSSLLTSIQTHLEAIPSNGSATFLPVDTGMPVDLIIEYADAQMLLAFIESLQAFQILSDAYDFHLDLSRSNYLNLLNNLRNIDDFERLLPALFGLRNSPERPVTQAKTLLTSALNRYLSNESMLWNRVSETYNTYLFEIDREHTSRTQQEWSTAVSSALSSLSNFTAAEHIAPSVKSGFEFTLSPLFGASAFDFRNDLLSENWDFRDDPISENWVNTDYSPYHFAAENGFAQRLLPPNFDGMCLVRFNEIGAVHEVDFIYKTDAQYRFYKDNYSFYYNSPDFDPFEGTLVLAPHRTTKRYNADAASTHGHYEYLQLTAETQYGGIWEMLSYNLGETASTASTGRYVLYPGVLDMDNDGMPDGKQLLQGFRVLPPASLSSNDIVQSEYGLSKTYQPASLTGKVYADLDQDFYAFFESNSTHSYAFAEMEHAMEEEWHSSSSDTGFHSYSPRTAKIDYFGGFDITFYKSPYEGAGFFIETDYSATSHTITYFNFSLYPSTLDLDKNGSPDGHDISRYGKLDLDHLPRRIDIETAENKAVDTDEDGLPDLLEARFGGSGTNPNDSSLTTEYLLNNDLYTRSEAQSMGVSSGINQVVQNPESYNLYTADSIKEMKLSGLTLGPVVGDKININYTVEESQTLGEWSTHSTGSMEVSLPEGNSFIRMRIDD
ncbi:MAG: hypothetical protein ACPGIC_05560 [Opitutales bacterium]